MKKISLIIILVISCVMGRSQTMDSLTIHYYENFPYAYTEGGKLKGIEIEIMEEYVNWVKQKKNISLIVTYKPYKEFSAFYNSIKDGSSKVVGLGSVTANTEREKEVAFSASYLRNVAVLITGGKIPTIKTKTAAEVSKTLGGLTAMVVNKSSHIAYTNDLKKNFIPALKIETTETQSKVLDKIVSDNNYFGYVDIVAYWAFLKNNPSKFLKIQKVFNEPKEFLGFPMAKNSVHLVTMNEFFESGFGFTSTRAYHQILENYLGYEIIDYVEIKEN